MQYRTSLALLFQFALYLEIDTIQTVPIPLRDLDPHRQRSPSQSVYQFCQEDPRKMVQCCSMFDNEILKFQLIHKICAVPVMKTCKFIAMAKVE